MNLLAHLYLSKGINDLMLGNFIGDFVKGNQYLAYSSEIQNGILLHREIDSFSDRHKAHKATRDKFRKEYGLHSGIVVDIIYDHYLAKNWEYYHTNKLNTFANKAYQYIQNNINLIPPQMQTIVPFIIENNWLVMYSSLEGVERVLYGMSKRTSLPEKVKFAMQVLNENYDEIGHEMAEIIHDLNKMVEKSLYLTKFATK